MAQKPKKTRKELLNEPDEFITVSARIIEFGTRYKSQLTYILAGIVILAVAISGYRFFVNRSEKAAGILLSQSMANYESAKSNMSPDGAYKNVSEDFQQLLKKYAGRSSGKIGRVIYANISYNAGEYSQAIDLYKASLKNFKDHPVIYQQILSSLGYAYQQLEDFDAAVPYFEQIVSPSSSVARDEALFNLGWLYEKLGQPQKSEEAFARILAEYQDSMYTNIVKERTGS